MNTNEQPCRCSYQSAATARITVWQQQQQQQHTVRRRNKRSEFWRTEKFFCRYYEHCASSTHCAHTNDTDNIIYKFSSRNNEKNSETRTNEPATSNSRLCTCVCCTAESSRHIGINKTKQKSPSVVRIRSGTRSCRAMSKDCRWRSAASRQRECASVRRACIDRATERRVCTDREMR
jgi:hypothetical protein